jgi:hypothetical protein
MIATQNNNDSDVGNAVDKLDDEKKQQPSIDVDVSFDKNADSAKNTDTAKNTDSAKNDDTAKNADSVKNADSAKNGDAVKPRDAVRSRPKLSRLPHGGLVKYSRIFKKVSPDGNLVKHLLRIVLTSLS